MSGWASTSSQSLCGARGRKKGADGDGMRGEWVNAVPCCAEVDSYSVSQNGTTARDLDDGRHG